MPLTLTCSDKGPQSKSMRGGVQGRSPGGGYGGAKQLNTIFLKKCVFLKSYETYAKKILASAFFLGGEGGLQIVKNFLECYLVENCIYK